MSEDFSHTKGLVALILGILSIVPCCYCGWILGPIAMFVAKSYTSECILAGVEPGGPGKFGKILGMIGTILGILVWLVGILWTLFSMVIMPAM